MNELSKKPTQPPKLNYKQLRFAEEYVVDSNGKQAAIRAGYSPHSAESKASALLRITKVHTKIELLKSEIAERNKITIDEIVANTREIIERCMQHAPVLDKKGNQVYVETANGKLTPAYTFQPAPAVKANELLARLGGLLNDVSPDTGDKYIGIVFNNYPHAQPQQEAIDAHTTNQQQIKP